MLLWMMLNRPKSFNRVTVNNSVFLTFNGKFVTFKGKFITWQR